MRINKDRLWDRLMEMATIGAIGETGSRRLALSKEDYQGRQLFTKWCHDIGMTVTYDQVGNLIATKTGKNPNLPEVMIGSHLDTQPNGGRFDGVLGVLAGLEAVQILHENKIQPIRTIKVVAWTNEEGVRFSPSMLGSSVYTGNLSLSSALATKDNQGITVKEALSELSPTEPSPPTNFPYAYLEMHIEQGPVLEKKNKTIGVVTGGQGLAWLDIKLTGFSAHAGTTPMSMRKDTLFAASAIWRKLEKMADKFVDSNITIGKIHTENTSYNTIIGELYFSLDLRNAEIDKLDSMIKKTKKIIKKNCQQRKIDFTIQTNSISPPQPFNQSCIKLIDKTTKILGYSKMSLISGAGHDAILLAKVCPTAMIFIPSKNGVSHNPTEYSTPEDIYKGTNVLLGSCLELANDKCSRFD